MVRSEAAKCQGNERRRLQPAKGARKKTGTVVPLTGREAGRYSAHVVEDPWPGAGEAGVYCLDTRRRIPLKYRRSHFHTSFALDYTQPEEVHEPMDSGAGTSSASACKCDRYTQPCHDGECGRCTDDHGEWWRTAATSTLEKWRRPAASPAVEEWWRTAASPALGPVTRK